MRTRTWIGVAWLVVVSGVVSNPEQLGARQAKEETSKEQREKLALQGRDLYALMMARAEEGNNVDALALARKVLQIMETVYSPKEYPDGHQELAAGLNNLAAMLTRMGEPSKALPYYEKALTISQKLYPENRFKDGHPSLATTLGNVGDVLQAMGEPGKALPYHEKALSMRQKLYPESRFKDGHFELAASLTNLGGMLQAMV